MSTTSILTLLVDDDVVIVELLKTALEDAGFEAVTAASGEDAVSLLETKTHDVRALITDVNLARDRLTGWDVAHRARELNPGLPVIYMTGASAAEWSAHGVPESVLLTKPFAPVQVVTAVSNLLNAAATRRAGSLTRP